MDRDTLIRLGSLLFVAVFVLELFAIRSSVQNQQTQQTASNNTEVSVYGTAQTTATLASYSDYLNVFKSGRDLSNNASLKQLGSIDGVAYFNGQSESGTVSLVLDQGANLPLIASKVKSMFPDLNVTAMAQFDLPSEIEFTTTAGEVNVSPNMIAVLEIDPTLEVGDNVTLMLFAMISKNQFAGAPSARIIPTTGEANATATVEGIGDEYLANVMLPWNMRDANTSGIKDELSAGLMNLSVNSTVNSYVVVKGLDAADNETIQKVGKLSYIQEIYGDTLYLNDSFNDSKLIESDLKGILGDNATVDYPDSYFTLSFYSENFSKEYLLQHVTGVPVVYRNVTLKLADKMDIAGSQYEVPANTTFDAMLLDSYSVGSNVSVILSTGTVGKRIVSLQLAGFAG